MNRCFFLFLVYFTTFISAQKPLNLSYDKHLQKPPGLETPSLSYVVFLLLVMTVTIVFIVAVIKKLWQSSGKLTGTKQLSIKDSLYLGNKTTLHVVDVYGKLVVIGVGPHQVHTITEIPPEQYLCKEDKITHSACFSDILNTVLSGKAK